MPARPPGWAGAQHCAATGGRTAISNWNMERKEYDEVQENA